MDILSVVITALSAVVIGLAVSVFKLASEIKELKGEQTWLRQRVDDGIPVPELPDREPGAAAQLAEAEQLASYAHQDYADQDYAEPQPFGVPEPSPSGASLFEPDPHRLVIPPPITNSGDTLFDWLRHHRPQIDFPELVRDFYGRAAGVPEVASFFADKDLAQIQKHFTAALIKVTKDGLTAAEIDGLRQAHADVRDEDGRPITVPIYDLVATTLAQTLADHGVPPHEVAKLDPALLRLRDEFAVQETHA